MEHDVVVVDRSASEIIHNPLDDVKIGDFYWVTFEECSSEKTVEELMCVEHIGSNFVQFKAHKVNCWDYGKRFESTEHGIRVHFFNFEKTCRKENNWAEIFDTRIERCQRGIREKTQALIREGQELSLIPLEHKVDYDPNQGFLPSHVSADPQKYKSELIELRDNTVPKAANEVARLGCELSVSMTNKYLPDMCKLGAVKNVLRKVGDKIFTIELYCGLQEIVTQIAEGESAGIAEPVAVYQQMLFMDEETLFDFDDGGMDFEKVEDFDKWVVKPENLNRILPSQRGIVAFKVRRNSKDYDAKYGRCDDVLSAWVRMSWNEANKQTYLLIRNGGNVYRILSAIDFSPRLIPKKGEIGDEQFKVIDSRFDWETREEKITERRITKDSIEFDSHNEQMEALLKQYNQIVILIQGLLDRSNVFYPHPVVNLARSEDVEKWITLIRDEEMGLPCNKVTFEEYQKQLNSTLERGKWIYIDSEFDERWGDGDSRDYDRSYRTPPIRGWRTKRMPDMCQVQKVKRDGSAVEVMWPKGEVSNPKKIWVPSVDRPGWGHYEYDYKSTRMCRQWIPIDRLINLSDYTPGDYRMFLCDRALRGSYLRWAQYLLTAEAWSQNRAKGLDPLEEKKAQASAY